MFHPEQPSSENEAVSEKDVRMKMHDRLMNKAADEQERTLYSAYIKGVCPHCNRGNIHDIDAIAYNGFCKKQCRDTYVNEHGHLRKSYRAFLNILAYEEKKEIIANDYNVSVGVLEQLMQKEHTSNISAIEEILHQQQTVKELPQKHVAQEDKGKEENSLSRAA